MFRKLLDGQVKVETGARYNFTLNEVDHVLNLNIFASIYFRRKMIWNRWNSSVYSIESKCAMQSVVHSRRTAREVKNAVGYGASGVP